MQNSPFIALITFGIPLACISCLVYCMCCGSFDNLHDAADEAAMAAAAAEARRARLLDRRFVEGELGSATYEETVRARSIYSRMAGESRNPIA